MAVVGIIAEYHPFHKGHAWQIRTARERLGEDTAVVAVMSGNFVQRGDFAMFSKHVRAEMALLGGVDLVLELPTPWASATAERFAQGGVALLRQTGVVTHLAFGCESGELEVLQQAVDGLNDDTFSERLQRHLATGKTFATARQSALEETMGERAQLLAQPNNALAVEYLRAIAAQDAPITPLALPRVGAAHDSAELVEYSSASAIRAQLLSGGEWHSLVSESTAEIISRELDAGRTPVTMKTCERAVLARLRSMTEEDFALYDGGKEGLYCRIYTAVHTGNDVEAILSAAKTKRYPLARLRRFLLHSYLGVPQAQQGESPSYLRVLGANERGRGLLRQMAKCASVPVITKPADARKLEDSTARTLFEQEARCTDLYTLAMPDLANALPDSEFRRPA
ncbi:MAG: nucleotidyltransferase family protein, partial [Oscillospiraceae bacterium]|nr:nucleotidyltransferase family protein [Oscillospiraceae bacterium]